MRVFAISLFILLSALEANAEYRVFLLRIGTYGSPPPYRAVKSNLSPRQYTGYYPLNPGEVIDYVDTWMCYGRKKDQYCPSPRNEQEILNVAPAIGQGFHPWDPFPYQPLKAAGTKTRSPAANKEDQAPTP